MSMRRIAVFVLVVAVLLVAAPATQAAKGGGGGKPPTDPPPDLTNPALVYAEGGGGLYLISADGSETQQLTSPEIEDRAPEWNPADPSQIGFLRRPDADWALADFYTINADGTGLTKVIDFFSMAMSGEFGQPPNEFAWSPDGSKIAFAPADIIWVADIATGDIQSLMPDGYEGEIINYPLSWSPDGSQIAYSIYTGPAGGHDIVVVDVDFEAFSYSILGPTSGPDKSPAWSSDGTRIAFWNGDVPGTLMVMDADGSNAQALASFDNGSLRDQPTWAPDDSLIGVAQRVPFRRKTTIDLLTIDVTSGTATNITGTSAHEHDPAWNPAWDPEA